MWITAFSEDIV